MKKTNLAMTTAALMLALNATAQAADTQPAKTWVKADQHVVYFAPKAELKVTLTHLGADDSYWDQLDVALDYEGSSAEQQATALRNAYPGYQVRRAVVSAQGQMTLSVPALGISVQVTPKPGQEGPYVNYTAFLSKAQGETIRRTFDSDPSPVKIEGKITADVPQVQVVERVELDPSVCDTLTAQGKTLFDAIVSYSEVRKQIDARTYRYSETKVALERSVLETCLDVPVERGAASFRELLSLPTQVRTRAERPFGETLREVPNSAQLPISYRLTKSASSGGDS